MEKSWRFLLQATRFVIWAAAVTWAADTVTKIYPNPDVPRAFGSIAVITAIWFFIDGALRRKVESTNKQK